jgi:hypothetical protein
MCLFCRTEIPNSVKEWNYLNGYYQVKHYNCLKCGGSFRAYYHDENLSHTIPRYVGTKNKIISFLKSHYYVTEKDIAVALELEEAEVLAVLLELEKEGKVEKK